MISFLYDENGQRIRKAVTENGNTLTTEYVVSGKSVTHVIKGTEDLHIFYANGQPSHCKYGNSMYTYVYSLQGDVLGLRDSSGSLVVTYLYDAWGKEISREGTLANTLGEVNPFRYRGYVYDTETRLYYLRSRYYDPNRCRFISSDSILGRTGGLLQHNLFYYCENGPVNHKDPSGMMEESLDDAGAGRYTAFAGMAAALATGNALKTLVDSISTVVDIIKIERPKTEKHHIVAQGDVRALSARVILWVVDIDINSDYNLVLLPYEYHKHLHTTLYHVYVSSYVWISFFDGVNHGDAREAVIDCLGEIKTQLLAFIVF